MTKAQIDKAMLEAEILLAAITELGEHIESGEVADEFRDELATDLWKGAAALAKFASAVAA